MIKKEKYERTFYKMTYVKINGAWTRNYNSRKNILHKKNSIFGMLI